MILKKVAAQAIQIVFANQPKLTLVSPSQGERLVFVGGAPRSGTTLLQHILDSHPKIFGGPEYECVPNIIATWRGVLETLGRGRITAFGNREQIDGAFIHLIEDLLLPAANEKGADLLTEKTPFNVFVFSDLLELMPRCRAIHIVRDPRAVVASILNVGKRAQAKNEPVVTWAVDFHGAVQMVKSALDSGHQARERFGDRLLTIKYEELVSNAKPTIRRVCAFMGMSFHPAMLEPHACKHPEQDTLVKMDNGTWVDPKLGFRPIEKSRVKVWKDDLDDSQAAAIVDALSGHPLMRSLGYSFE